jgi:ABC-type multidrug transport system fused ATPase/permease subunit
LKYFIWIIQNTKGIRINSLIRIVIGIARVSCGLLTVWLSKYFIDVTIRTGSPKDIYFMIGLLVITVITVILLRQAYYYMTIAAGIRQTNAIRLSLFSQLFSRQLFDEHEIHSGDVTSRMSKDIETVSNATTDIIPLMIVTGTQLLGAFLLMQSMDKRLAWALLLITPVMLFLGKLISRHLRKMTHDIRQDESHIQMRIQEGMEQNAVLRALGSEAWLTELLDGLQVQLEGNMMKRARFIVGMRIIMGCVFGLGYMIAFIWGGLQLRNGIISVGVLTSFLQLVGQIQNPILTLMNIVPQLIQAAASIDRLEELESVPKQNPEEKSKTYHLPSLQDECMGIRITNASFRYASGDRQILNQFSHDFKPGSKTALMGPTGIGKTTLFRLMLSLVNLDEGRISIYNNKVEHDISEATRPYFVFVPQGNTLMSGSIRNNLLLAKPDASDEELKDVLHTAAADFVFDLPETIDTELGERGSGLSEGQAQRIAIARGLLRPGSILLLDEISASLDEQTESLLYNRLFAKYPKKTMIFITHRTSITRICDETIQWTE